MQNYSVGEVFIFSNSLDPDQAQLGARSGSKLFDTLMAFLKEFYEKVYFEKNQQTTKRHAKLPSRQSVNEVHFMFIAHASFIRIL